MGGRRGVGWVGERGVRWVGVVLGGCGCGWGWRGVRWVGGGVLGGCGWGGWGGEGRSWGCPTHPAVLHPAPHADTEAAASLPQQQAGEAKATQLAREGYSPCP